MVTALWWCYQTYTVVQTVVEVFDIIGKWGAVSPEDAAFFPVGSILRRPVEGNGGQAFFHEGILMPGGKVIHFNGERKGDMGAILREDSLFDFANGALVHCHLIPKDEAHSMDICSRARDLVDNHQNNFNGNYCFLLNNCQDFCRHCFGEIGTPGQRDLIINASAKLAAAQVIKLCGRSVLRRVFPYA
jgi:hypothetical protein